MLDSSDRQLPDLLVIGAMKAATSTVSDYLESHPDVFMVSGEDPNFFAHDDKWDNGQDWYRGLFAGRTTERLAGESSNSYTNVANFPHAAARAASLVPDAKLIYMVRHPVDRIISAWLQYRVDQPAVAPLTLDGTVTEQADAYVVSSMYWHQLQAWRAHYCDDQILVLFMDEMKASPDTFYPQIDAFLDLAPAPKVEAKVVNPSAGKRAPNARYNALKSLPGVRSAARALLPEAMRRKVVKGVLSSEITERPAFSDAVKAELLARLEPDVAEFLRYCGKPADYWTL